MSFRFASPARLLLWTSVVLGIGVLLGSGIPEQRRGTAVEASTGLSSAPATPLPRSSGSTDPFVSVADAVLPGVVSVEARRWMRHPDLSANDSESTDPEASGEEEGEEDSEASPLPWGEAEEIPVPSSGSGFVFDAAGHVFTNNHVVKGASRIRVHLADGRELNASVVGVDPQTDVAVLRVASDTPLPIVPLGDSDGVRIGEWVAAIGNPLGIFDGSLTVGVVSAKGRNEVSIRGGTPIFQDFLQTDASINFGNSGGPLVNSRGEAIGINTAFSGPGDGIGFAIPINLAREVAQSLIERGKIVRGYLGVVLQDLDPDLAQGFQLPNTHGAIVREVQPGTPAAAGGLRAGDVVVALDGEQVRDVASFRLRVARLGVGRKVAIQIYRYGSPQEIHVVLAERPSLAGDPAEDETPAHADPTRVGLSLKPVPRDAEVGRLVPERALVVDKLEADGVGAEVGLRVGDVILAVDGAAPGSEREFERELAEAFEARRPAVLHIARGQGQWFVALPYRPEIHP